MPIAAVPRYLGDRFDDASPALRFGMFLKLWGVDSKSKKRLWTTHDVNYRPAGRNREERRFEDENKTDALEASASLNSYDCAMIENVAGRQHAVFRTIAEDDRLRLIATSVAPFSTGLGNEHPLENGFTFLNPYGVPCLPGSGVKGVVRRAAEELAHRDLFPGDGGWTLPKVWRLFGFEPWPEPGDEAAREEWEQWVGGFAVSREEIETYLDTVLEDSESHRELKTRVLDVRSPLRELLRQRNVHVRGALEFWDVVPQFAEGQELTVEVMTPHYSHYYQSKPHAGSRSPHDSGRPTPIDFLTVPPDVRFTFHVRCNRERLFRCAPELVNGSGWRPLLESAFDHAFEWLGFGAKSAVGYGAMAPDEKARKEEQAAREEAARQQAEREARAEEEERRAQLPPVEREIMEILDQRPDPTMRVYTAIRQEIEGGRWQGEARVEVAKWLERTMKKEGCWKEKSSKKNPKKDRDYQETLRVKEWQNNK